MSVKLPTRTDRQVQAAVEAELEWTPDVDAAGIGVAVDDGIVSLSGEVRVLAERTAAKRAALRVRDVRTVVDDVKVQPNSAYSVSELDIAKEVEHALRSATDVPATVKAEITENAVTLVGLAEWDFQRRAAERAVQSLRGVHSVDDRIALTPRESAAEAAEQIRSAIARNAQLDPTDIQIIAAGNKVTLSGTVQSWAQRRQADLAAWSSPHVSEVYNHIVVRSS